MKSRLTRLLFAFGRIYLLLLVVLAAFQRKLLFFPTRGTESEMLATANSLGFEPWRGQNGTIIGWKTVGKSRPASTHKLLVLHGNAGFALHREDYAHAFEALDDGATWEVRLLEYPGYGARPGSPNRNDFAAAATEAVKEWRSASAAPVYLLGESIGSGPVCDLAAEDPGAIAGLILVTPFASLADVAQTHFPFLPVRLILRDRWDNVSALAKYPGRVAVIIAGKDEVVGTAQGQLLFDSLHCPKSRWFFSEATHNDSDIQGAEWAAEVSAFVLDSGSQP